MEFLVQGQIKTESLCAFYAIFVQEQLKTNFSHPVWYDLVVEDELSTNSATIVD